MFVTIESAIVHVFNQADGYPIFSDIPIALDAEFETYLSATIQKLFLAMILRAVSFSQKATYGSVVMIYHGILFLFPRALQKKCL